MAIPRVGGSFAPPLPALKVITYKELAEKAPPHIREGMLKLCDMALKFHETPESREEPASHITGMAMVPLEPAEVERMDEHIPWRHELDGYSTIFDELNPETQRDIRDAAFHLLWLANELYLDREPMTLDRVGFEVDRDGKVSRAPKVRENTGK